MYASIYIALATAFAVLIYGSPLPQCPPSPLHNFLLVTTNQSEPEPNSADLTNVNATSLFDPFDQQNFLLRLIGPGYGSLPRFNLSDGTLSTLSQGIEGFGSFVYNSTVVEEGNELQFLPSSEPGGSLGLKDNYLLTVDGEEKGWTICAGELGELVIAWKGPDLSCIDTYIQAVQKAPY